MNSGDQLRSASGEDFVRLIHETPPAHLLPALDNPTLNEELLCLLLQRKDLAQEFLQEVLVRRHFLKSYRVKKALAFHPHTPRTEGIRLLRELYLMDLVQFAISPGVPPDLKIKAEEQVIAKLPQVPLGQKITLARKAPARITGALLAEGNAHVIKAALANPNLTEAQVLRVLSRDKLPAIVVQSVAQDAKWGHVYNVRIALIRQPATTLTHILAFLPELTISDLRELVAPGVLPENLRHYLQAEIQRRMQRSKEKAEPPAARADRESAGERDSGTDEDAIRDDSAQGCGE
jgi:hypothetical protein